MTKASGASGGELNISGGELNIYGIYNRVVELPDSKKTFKNLTQKELDTLEKVLKCVNQAAIYPPPSQKDLNRLYKALTAPRTIGALLSKRIGEVFRKRIGSEKRVDQLVGQLNAHKKFFYGRSKLNEFQIRKDLKNLAKLNEAVTALEDAASSGHVFANFILVQAYEQKKEVEKNPEEQKKLDEKIIKAYTKGAELGHERCQFELGKIYYTMKDYEQADKWLQKAIPPILKQYASHPDDKRIQASLRELAKLIGGISRHKK